MGSQKKLKLYVFIPTSSCVCNFGKFMDRIFQILVNYKDKVKFEVKDVNSPEAEEFKIMQNSIVLLNPPEGDHLIFRNSVMLKRFLEKNFKN
ncbi:MAG: hypothetical protein DRO88_14270 [Promethearchaeia archaeon]|nr:MAG: hypothetical protein DRO88_14270 [Candidatus Lokiarchaeia archaeon]